MITFRPFSNYKLGLILDMLMKSYASYPEIINLEKASWQDYDSNIFKQPETIGKCGFVSCLEDVPVGFASWDPRNHPNFVLIGHNCILPNYQKRGFGRLQILEMLNRFKTMKFKKVKTSTGTNNFFVPAQKMYVSCGFYETARSLHERMPNFEVIHYEKIIFGRKN